MTLETQSVGMALMTGVASSCALVVAPMITYYVLWIRKDRVRSALLLCLPVFVLLFVIGTRYLLLFATAGVATICLAARPLSLKTLVHLLLVAAFLLMSSAYMKRFRSTGILETEDGSLTTGVSANELTSSEGAVGSMSMIVDYFGKRDHLHGASNLGILLFWVPRSMWPEKRTFVGHWFPRAYGLTGFSEGHSVAATFAADAYVDFGFYGGILFCGLLGSGFGLLERWSARIISLRSHPLIATTSILYGAAFFAVRSLDTTIVSMSGTIVVGLLFATLGGARSRRTQPLRVPAPSYARVTSSQAHSR